MSDRFTFWTRDVFPEHTKEYTGEDYGLYLRRAGWGTQVKQNQGTNNWFHFPIPSASHLDDDGADHYHAWVRFKINDHAKVDRVLVAENDYLTHMEVLYDNGYNVIGREVELDFNLPDTQCKGPLLISVHVDFFGEGGEVLFAGAGAWFEEWT